MPARTDTYDLGRLRLTSGEGRKLDLEISLGDFDFAGERYATEPASVPARLDVSKTTGGGYALRLRFQAALSGPCMRCLEHAAPTIEVDVREVDQPGGGDELSSPYMEGEELDVQAWAHDAFSLALPNQVICRPDCAGLCPICGENLNTAGPEHRHDVEPDPRWAKLRELKLED